jgi:hypothetical protein
VVPTEAGDLLLERLGPVMTEVESALDLLNGFRESIFGTSVAGKHVRSGHSVTKKEQNGEISGAKWTIGDKKSRESPELCSHDVPWSPGRGLRRDPR